MSGADPSTRVSKTLTSYNLDNSSVSAYRPRVLRGAEFPATAGSAGYALFGTATGAITLTGKQMATLPDTVLVLKAGAGAVTAASAANLVGSFPGIAKDDCLLIRVLNISGGTIAVFGTNVSDGAAQNFTVQWTNVTTSPAYTIIAS